MDAAAHQRRHGGPLDHQRNADSRLVGQEINSHFCESWGPIRSKPHVELLQAHARHSHDTDNAISCVYTITSCLLQRNFTFVWPRKKGEIAVTMPSRFP
jgi:hypothetical protein